MVPVQAVGDRFWRWFFVVLVLGWYGIAFFLPTYISHNSGTWLGWQCFIQSLSPFGFVAWCANPVFWIGCILLLCRQGLVASVLGVLALLLGCCRPGPTENVLIGHYWWLGSFVLLIVIGLVVYPSTRAALETEKTPNLMAQFWRTLFVGLVMGWYVIAAALWAWGPVATSPYPIGCWFANPFFWVACVLLACGKGRTAAGTGGVALFLGLNGFVEFDSVLRVVSLAFLWWMSSFALLVMVSLFQALAIEPATDSPP